MANELDPFSMLYDALWTLVERNQLLLDVIPVRNRIKYNEESPPKQNIATADRPELILLSSGIKDVTQDSSNSQLTKEYIYVVTSEDFRINPSYNRISFALYRSLIDWCCVLSPLSWCGCNFVINCILFSVEEGTEQENYRKQILGWTGLWTVDVVCSFPLNKLKLPVT